jgi:hypothetical protein
MSPAERKKSNWLSVKAALSQLKQDELLGLLRDLYEISPGNKQFMEARLRIGTDQIKPYKKIVGDCMYPDVYRNRPVQIAKAKKTISDYRKAAPGDVFGAIDLMIFFVECGNRLTREFGDIDEPFYDALLSMYAKAVEAIVELPEPAAEPFRKRLQELTESSKGIGWGYHDGLCDEYYSAFPEGNSE